MIIVFEIIFYILMILFAIQMLYIAYLERKYFKEQFEKMKKDNERNLKK